MKLMHSLIKKKFSTTHMVIFLFALLHTYLVIYGSNTGDIKNYINRLHSNLYYSYEVVFTVIQFFLIQILSPETVILTQRLILIFIVTVIAVLTQSRLSFLLFLHPIIIVGLHNSIRQSLSVLLLAVAFTLVTKLRHKIPLMLLAIFSHISGFFSLFLIILSNYYKKISTFKAIQYIIAAIILSSLLGLQILEILASYANKDNYLRSEEFGASRFGSDFKAMYIGTLGLLPWMLTGTSSHSHYLFKRFLVFGFIACILALNIATDGIFRLIYAFLILDFIYFLKNSDRVSSKAAILIHLANPAGFTMIAQILN